MSGLFADKLLVVRRRQQRIHLLASLSSSFSIHVVFASALIFSGASFNSSFTAVTVPDTGENRSDHRLHLLHRAEDLSRLHRIAHLRQLDEHNVAQRVLRVVRNADRPVAASTSIHSCSFVYRYPADKP